jgi:mono/diheme cytochrome c family protein
MRRLRALAAALPLAGAAHAALADAPQPAPPQYPDGAATFKANCAVCHGPTGGGVPSLAPPLTHYPSVYATHPEGRRQLAMMVLFGMFGGISVDGQNYNFKMPDFSRFSDEVLAGVLNHVVFDLGAAAPLPAGAQRAPLEPAEVAALREPRLTGEQVRAHRDALLPQVGL